MKRTRALVVGLVIAGLLGLADLAALPTSDGENPPLPIAVILSLLGLITVIGVFLAWRGRRSGGVMIIVTRLLSALSTVPAFFVDAVGGTEVVLAGVGIVATLVAVVLVAAGLRSQAKVAV